MKKFAKIFLSLVIFLLFSFIGLYFGTSGDYHVADTVASDPSIPHINVNGYNYHSESFGADTSQVIIVIHGGPGNDYKNLLTLKALSDEYRVVFYDQRGSGLSPRVDKSQLTLESSLSDLSDIVDHFSPQRRVTLIGHSWGAMLACGYIIRHPERVRKVVVAEPGMLTSEAAKEFGRHMKVDFSFDLAGLIIKAFFESMHLDSPDEQARMDYIFQRIAYSTNVDGNPMVNYFCDEKPSEQSKDYWRIGAMANFSIRGASMNEHDEMEIDLVTGLDKYDPKILMLTGECNQLIGMDFQKEYHIPYFKNIESVEIEGTGHMMLSEKPEICLPIIRRHIEE